MLSITKLVYFSSAMQIFEGAIFCYNILTDINL